MFAKSKDEPEMANSSTAPARAIKPVPTNSAPSIIGSDVKIIGNVSTQGEIQLDGIVEGDISCGAMTMGEHGTLNGSVSADTVVIRGKMTGKIRGRAVRLEKSAKVKGDIWHETIAIEAGADVQGHFRHGTGEKRGATNAAEPKAAEPKMAEAPKSPSVQPELPTQSTGNGKR